MRTSLILSLALIGCGGRVVADDSTASPDSSLAAPADEEPVREAAVDSPIEASVVADGATETGVVAIGCPTEKPTNGQLCRSSSGIYDDNFYCHYHANESACATPVKCSNQRWSGGTVEDCRVEASACTAGAKCGAVSERDGACIVQCNRICRCVADGTLQCSPINCCPEPLPACSPTVPCPPRTGACIAGCCVWPGP